MHARTHRNTHMHPHRARARTRTHVGARAHTRNFFRSKGITPHAYSPLDHGALATNALCQSIGRRQNKTAAQVAMRWVVQNGVTETALLTRSASQLYLEQDVDIFSWRLSSDDIMALDNVTCVTHPELCTYYSGGARMAWGCTN